MKLQIFKYFFFKFNVAWLSVNYLLMRNSYFIIVTIVCMKKLKKKRDNSTPTSAPNSLLFLRLFFCSTRWKSIAKDVCNLSSFSQSLLVFYFFISSRLLFCASNITCSAAWQRGTNTAVGSRSHHRKSVELICQRMESKKLREPSSMIS